MSTTTSAAKIVAVPLGAGQEIGRSCVVVRMGGHSVMFDCGIHTAFTDERCFPRFDMLLPGGAAAAVAAAGGGVLGAKLHRRLAHGRDAVLQAALRAGEAAGISGGCALRAGLRAGLGTGEPIAALL